MTPSLPRSILRWALRTVATLVVLVVAFLAAALVGAMVHGADASGGTEKSVTVYLSTNGFHSDIVVPVRSPERDWSLLLGASPLTAPSLGAARWIAFGWGSETAYTRLEKITDMSPAILLKAIAFDRSVVHVVPLETVGIGEGVWLLQISSAGYRRLAAAIDASFARDPGGREILLPGVTHGYGDAFFRGARRFSFLRSCNVWVGELLRTAGIRAGIWTPFAQSLTWSVDLPKS